MNVTLKQLRAFMAVSRMSSFTLAAEQINITQSALSGLIKELEDSLGVRVFDRSTRKISLSPTGAQIHDRIEKILTDLDSTLQDVTSLKELRRGVVRIAAPQLMACTLLPRVMAAFSRRHPDIALKLIDCAVESVSSRVFNGEVDIGLGPERHHNSDITASVLFELPFYAVFRPGHPLSQHDVIRWNDLMSHPLITLQGEFTDRLAIELKSIDQNKRLSPEITVNFMSSALSMVAANRHYATICIPYTASLVKQHNLLMRPLIDPVINRCFYSMTKASRSLSPAARAFRQFLTQQIHDSIVDYRSEVAQ